MVDSGGDRACGNSNALVRGQNKMEEAVSSPSTFELCDEKIKGENIPLGDPQPPSYTADPCKTSGQRSVPHKSGNDALIRLPVVPAIPVLQPTATCAPSQDESGAEPILEDHIIASTTRTRTYPRSNSHLSHSPLDRYCQSVAPHPLTRHESILLPSIEERGRDTTTKHLVRNRANLDLISLAMDVANEEIKRGRSATGTERQQTALLMSLMDLKLSPQGAADSKKIPQPMRLIALRSRLLKKQKRPRQRVEVHRNMQPEQSTSAWPEVYHSAPSQLLDFKFNETLDE